MCKPFLSVLSRQANCLYIVLKFMRVADTRQKQCLNIQTYKIQYVTLEHSHKLYQKMSKKYQQTDMMPLGYKIKKVSVTNETNCFTDPC